MTMRVLKSLLVAAVGVWMTLVALDNLLDYDSNAQFVRHVLSMDTVFPDNALKYRAITDSRIQALVYWMIIGTQWFVGLLCLAGAWRLFAARRDRRAFVAAKTVAACGLALLFLLYYLGFIVIGGEWFSMWQSQIWNGQAAAFRFLTCALLVLIVLLLPEEQDAP